MIRMLCLGIICIIVLTSCNSIGGSKEAKQYLDNKGFKLKSYIESRSEILTKDELTRLPKMMYWSVVEEKPDQYIDKNITVERFIVSHHPKGDSEVYVMSNAGHIIGGYSVSLKDTGKRGWVNSIDGKTLEELQSLDYPTWLKKWQEKYQ
jgi:hypothetical protein